MEHPDGQAVEDHGKDGGVADAAPHEPVDGPCRGQVGVGPEEQVIQGRQPRDEAMPEMICTTTSMAKKKATDSSILCWAKLWPMARGV